jgi:hypothetical protein
MRNLETLRADRAHHAKEIRDLMASTDGKKWTPKNQATYDQHMAEIATIDDEGKRLNDFNATMAGDSMSSADTLLTNRDAGNNDPSATLINVDGRNIPILSREQKVANFYPKQHSGYEEPGQVYSLKDFALANMGMGGPKNAVTSGTAIVEESLAAQLIDAVRAKSVVNQAGGSTILIDGPSNIARIVSDATVYEHTEGAADVSESTPVFDAVAANPKALVALVPLSAEVVADSKNLNQVLFTSLAAAFAGKFDSLALATLLADTDIPTSAAGEDCDTWPGTLSAVGSAMALNQGIPGALISSTADFIARASSLNTTGDWVGRPELMKSMLELPTTKITAGTQIFGDWAKSFATIIRQGLSIEIVRFAKSTSYSHLLVAHARMAGYVLQPNGLYVQEQTVV